MRCDRYKSSWLCLLMLLMISTPPVVTAASDLDQWLAGSAGPALISLIKQEPRFIGEAISFSGLKDGRPVPFNDELSLRVRDSLRQMMLEEPGIIVPLANSHGCSVARYPIVLGIDIKEESQGRYRVQLALLDLDDQLWINGSSQIWFGRLTQAQVRAHVAPPPDITPTFTADDIAAIARHLDTQLDCHPGLPQPVYLESEHEALRVQLTAHLESRFLMTDEPLAALTRLTLTNPAGETLLLEARGTSGSNLSLAQARLRASESAVDLLSDITRAPGVGDCRGHGPQCIDLRVEAAEPVYVMEFITMNGKLLPLACELELTRVTGGISRSLKVPQGTWRHRPSLGYYVLATKEPVLARQLRANLHGDSCGGEADPERLSQLTELVSDERVAWRSIHFENSQGRVHTFRSEP